MTNDVSLDPIIMDLKMAALPLHPSEWICQQWIEMAERDIYQETVDSRGFDPLVEIEWEKLINAIGRL